MKQKESENRINYLIKDLTVRLVGDNVTNGVIDTKNAIRIAREMELDLVEISGPQNGNPPICRIVDYQKYLYDKKKKDKDQKKKQKLSQSEVKEIRMTPNIDEHDFNFKLNHARNFLTNNDKVLVSVFFKGREITYKDQGQIVLLNFAKELEDIGIPEYLPKLEGKKMLMMIKPKLKK
jgi:translation initiation factor IF-3